MSISEINVRMTNVMKGCDEYFMYDPYEGKREGESRRDAVLGSADDAGRLTDRKREGLFSTRGLRYYCSASLSIQKGSTRGESEETEAQTRTVSD